MPNKDYIITDHAKARMKRRNISENEIKKVLNNPEISYPGVSGEIKFEKTLTGGKRVRVVFKIEKGKKKILTVILIN